MKNLEPKKKDSAEVKLRIWMIRNNLNQITIAREYGAGRAFVSQFVQGVKTSNGLAKFLIDKGCPEDCFKNGRLIKCDSNNAA